MVVLWLTNIPLPIFCEAKKVEGSNLGGWLDIMSRQLSLKNRLVSVYMSNEVKAETLNLNSYYSFCQKENNLEYFRKIIKTEQPDIIHIWGTEFMHSYQMVSASEKEGKIKCTLISIQGSSFFVGKNHYYAGLPSNVINGYSFRDFLKQDNIAAEKKLFDKRGKWEIEAIKIAKNVMGRTTWDKAITYLINPNIKYFGCNETLRTSFYGPKWNLANCNRHRLFMSQGQYPIKGFHMALEALIILKTKYPDIILCVAGINMMAVPFYRRTNYQNYILKVIKQNQLTLNVKFLGNLTEAEMVEEYKKAHVYISASSIENSSNSLGEAMMVGCPCVASNVGGTADMIKDKVEGFLYPFNEPYMLAYYLDKIFNSDELALEFSNNASTHAMQTHDPSNNFTQLLEVYSSLWNRKGDI